MSFLFDKLFQKQNPELASAMAKRGLIFDRIRHRWVRKPENRAQPQTDPSQVHDTIWDGSEVKSKHSELDFDDSREMLFQRQLQHTRGENQYQKYINTYDQVYGHSPRGGWLDLHWRLEDNEKHNRNTEKRQKGFATEKWSWEKDPSKKRLDKLEIGLLEALTQENDHAGAMEHIAQFLGDKHLANRASKNRTMRDERRTSTDNRRWMKFDEKVYGEIKSALQERIKNASEVHQAM